MTGRDLNKTALRILIVDDNLINRKTVERMVGKLGHRATQAESGEQALELLDGSDSFDVILMDRHMPGMDGTEATKRIRKMTAPVGTIPIIAITAAVTQREIADCHEAGMNEVVSKPVDPAQLSAALVRVITTTTDEKIEDDQAPILDVDVLKHMGEEFDDDGLAELIEDFKKFGAESVDKFTHASQESALEPMTRYAHDLKSNAATLGLKRLSALARHIELASVEERVDDARALGDGLPDVFEEALAALAHRDEETKDEKDENNEKDPLLLFLAKMAHDIRNKMGIVVGYAAMMQEYSTDIDTPEDLNSYALEIQEESTYMAKMAADILTLVRIETGRYTLAPEALDPQKSIENCIAEVTADTAEDTKRGVTVTAELNKSPTTTTVKADAKVFHRMLACLLTNAIRVSPDNGTVRLAFEATSDSFVIKVTDAGPGMTEQEIATAHSPFGRVWEKEGQSGIAGLYYNIAARLAALHGGRLEIDSTPGEGNSQGTSQGTSATIICYNKVT